MTAGVSGVLCHVVSCANRLDEINRVIIAIRDFIKISIQKYSQTVNGTFKANLGVEV